MDPSERSPGIVSSGWGSIETHAGRFRDARLWPGGGAEWDWRATGTHHRPGVQPEDVDELLVRGADRVIVGCGRQGRLEVMQETRDVVAAAGADLEVLPTGEAVTRYNDAAERGEAVAALIHTTC